MTESMNAPCCAACGTALRFFPDHHAWGCDRCRRMFPLVNRPRFSEATPAPSKRALVGVGAGVALLTMIIIVAARSDAKTPAAGNLAPPGEADPGAAGQAPAGGSGQAPAGQAAEAGPAPAAAPAAAAAHPAAGGLPRSEDVLPRGEVSSGSVVVASTGFRHQVPAGARPASVLGAEGQGWTWIARGFIGDAPLTVYVEKRDFTGQLADFAAEAKMRIVAGGGKVTLDGPVMASVAGRMANDHAHRLIGRYADIYDMMVLIVHDSGSYIFHCQTPNVANAWANVGTDCLVRGTTFHVAPPAGPGSTRGQ
jgi:hypothetical protein